MKGASVYLVADSFTTTMTYKSGHFDIGDTFLFVGFDMITLTLFA